jgi:hypothetical protein
VIPSKGDARYELPIPDIARIEARCPGCGEPWLFKVYTPRMTLFGVTCYCGAMAEIDPAALDRLLSQ